MKSNLGRGLDSLIPTGKESTDRNTGIATVRIESIRPNPYQPRTTFDTEKLNELANSLAESGMIQPIIVTKNANSEYELIAGERRLEAAKIAGFTEIPVIIRCVSPREQLQFALIENIQRENLSPIEEAKAYLQLQEKFDLTHQDIARFMGKDRVTVTNTVRLLKLPSDVQALIEQGKISSGHGRALLQLNEDAQTEFAAIIVNKNYSVRETERRIKTFLNRKPAESSGETVKNTIPDYVYGLRDRLQSKLSVPVRVEAGQRGGTISIRFRDEDELKKVLEMILPAED